MAEIGGPMTRLRQQAIQCLSVLSVCAAPIGCVELTVIDGNSSADWVVRLSSESGTLSVVEGPVRNSGLFHEESDGPALLLGYRREQFSVVERPQELAGKLLVSDSDSCRSVLPKPDWTWTNTEGPLLIPRPSVPAIREGCAGPWSCHPIYCSTDIRKISTGDDHACGLDGEGIVHCWAQANTEITGRRSDAAQDDYVVPNLKHVVDIAVGGAHTCALTANGRVWCWGSDASHQLDTNSNLGTSRSVQLANRHRAVNYIAADGYRTCVLHHEAGLSCWGGPFSSGHRIEPGTLPGLATAFSVGVGLTCVISDRIAYCVTEENESWLDRQPLANDVGLIAVHAQRACALGDRSVHCFDYSIGQNQDYELLGELHPVDLHLSDAGWCVVFEDGQLHCEHPELTTDRLPPDIRVRPYPGSISLSKEDAACLILADQSVRCTGTTTSTIVPLPRPN